LQFLLGAELIKIVLLTQLLSPSFQVVTKLSYYKRPTKRYLLPSLPVIEEK